MKRSTWLAAIAAAALGPAAACAQVSDDVVKIGVIADMTGPYSAIGGSGSVRAVELAVKEFGGTVLGKPIEVVSANHQLKVDIAVAKAKEWLDQDKVDAIIETTDSASAIAMGKVAAQRKRPIFYGSGAASLINQDCSPYGMQWIFNTQALAAGTARALVKSGGPSWYFISADYAFGQQMEREAGTVVKQAGGTVMGSTRVPLNSSDFASPLLLAQASKADVVALANAGKDTQNAIRQAAEFGLTKKQSLAALMIFEPDIKGMGLEVSQGLQYTGAFYWDMNPEARAFAEKFEAVQKVPPTWLQAGAYSAALQYLKAVATAKTDAPDAVMKQLRSMPIEDLFAKNGHLREDGLLVHDMYLFEAKKPSESKGEWDISKLRATIPGSEAFQPLTASECPLVKKG